MTIDIQVLCRNIEPEKTILIFGSGSSIPSGGPSANVLREKIFEKFNYSLDDSLSLSSIATIIEKKKSRKELIEYINQELGRIRPTAGILNLPMFNWAGLYTTNYDEIIEQAFAHHGHNLNVYSSNFDYSSGGATTHQSLYKLHGTIHKDTSLGDQATLVITESDYDHTYDYRQLLYSRLAEQLFSHSVIIIGQSLSDPHLKALIDEALKNKKSQGAPGKISLFIYEENQNQAIIYEDRGFDVCFGGIDDFFSELTKLAPAEKFLISSTDDPIDSFPELRPITFEISDEKHNLEPNLHKMFNGSPASYADITAEWTFERDYSNQLEVQLVKNEKRIAYVLGSAGVGKTTACRQMLCKLIDRDIRCLEHKSDYALPADKWIQLDIELRKQKKQIVLFIDDAHDHLREINKLVEAICIHDIPALKLVLTSSNPHWNPRTKSNQIFAHGIKYDLSILSEKEINYLIDLLEKNKDIATLVEDQFLGYSRREKYRRIQDRCSADMFVCMRNIFGSQRIDNIILKEFADLDIDYQDIYKQVATMEAAGVCVHRQLVMRVTGLEAKNISRTLDDLEGIIEEYSVNEKEGIYAWRIRHQVIAEIISKHKYPSQDEFFGFMEHLINNMNPTYNIEVTSLNEMCNYSTGIGKLHEKQKQNILLRKMISLAPFQNVPRHRLITNLIEMEEYDIAENEIRIFEKERKKKDGPVHRYKIKLKLNLAKNSPGIQEVDRIAMVLDAISLAQNGIKLFSQDKNMYRSYLETGHEYYKLTNDSDYFDQAMKEAKRAKETILDPDMDKIISRYETKFLGFKHAV
ncbi:MAG: SIR2 family protein [Rhodomicrobiaceae bacterium]